MSDFGFKQININNICEPDPTLRAFVKIDTKGQFQPFSLKDYLKYIMALKLNKNVPRDIQAMFEVVKGAMAYGYYYYPLFWLAAEQVFKIAESALLFKCKEMGAPKSKFRFAEMINWLTKKGIIHESEKDIWDAIRQLRNISYHPEQLMIFPPNMAIGTIHRILEKINIIFSESDKSN